MKNTKTMWRKRMIRTAILIGGVLLVILILAILDDLYDLDFSDTGPIMAIIISVSSAAISSFRIRKNRKKEKLKATLDFLTESYSERILSAREMVYRYARSKKKRIESKNNTAKPTGCWKLEEMNLDELSALEEDENGYNGFGKAFGITCNFYERWGYMYFNGYCAYGVFKNSAGATAVRMFRNLAPFINGRRRSNPRYCEYFMKLIDEIEHHGDHPEEFLDGTSY